MRKRIQLPEGMYAIQCGEGGITLVLVDGRKFRTMTTCDDIRLFIKAVK